MGTAIRVGFGVPARLVPDEVRLQSVLSQALDQLAAHAQASGWRLQGAPTAYIFQPDQAAALGLSIPLPREPDDYLVVMLIVSEADELAAQMAR